MKSELYEELAKILHGETVDLSAFEVCDEGELRYMYFIMYANPNTQVVLPRLNERDSLVMQYLVARNSWWVNRTEEDILVANINNIDLKGNYAIEESYTKHKSEADAEIVKRNANRMSVSDSPSQAVRSPTMCCCEYHGAGNSEGVWWRY